MQQRFQLRELLEQETVIFYDIKNDESFDI